LPQQKCNFDAKEISIPRVIVGQEKVQMKDKKTKIVKK